MHGPLCAQKHTRGMGALFSIFTLPLHFFIPITWNINPKSFTQKIHYRDQPATLSFFGLAILNSPRNGGLLLPLLKAFKRLL